MNSPPDSSPDLLEQAVGEFLAAAESSAELDRSALLGRYPQVADELAAFIQDHDRLHRLAQPLRARPAGMETLAHTMNAPSRVGNEPTMAPSQGSSTDEGPRQVRRDAGRYFGGYELLEEVARGGMGVVYKARHLRLNRIVALKMILAGQLAALDDVKRFHAEAEAAAGLDHPGIVPVYEVAELEGQHYFTMGFVEGQSLADLLQAGPLPPQTAAELMKKLAEAVAYAHSKGILHRDLKPANVLLQGKDESQSKVERELSRSPTRASGSPLNPPSSMQPKITDFGLAKRLDSESSLTVTGQILGTPSYMPPERAAGQLAEVRETADIYSLGAILYAMLTGRPPFVAESPLDVIVQVLESEPTLPNKLRPGLPQGLEWICLRCLERDPARRYVSAAALAEDLDRFLRQEPVEARPAAGWQRLRRWARREPALASHLGAVLLALVIVQVKFIHDHSDWQYHLRVTGVLSAWGLSAVVFQWLLNRERWSEVARYLWSAADVIMVTALLVLIAPPLGPLQVGYPLLVAASGLFFRTRLVACTTVLAILGDATLWLLRPADAPPLHYMALFWTSLAILGCVVGYQVRRVRVLSQYYEHRNLP